MSNFEYANLKLNLSCTLSVGTADPSLWLGLFSSCEAKEIRVFKNSSIGVYLAPVSSEIISLHHHLLASLTRAPKPEKPFDASSSASFFLSVISPGGSRSLVTLSGIDIVRSHLKVFRRTLPLPVMMRGSVLPLAIQIGNSSIIFYLNSSHSASLDALLFQRLAIPHLK